MTEETIVKGFIEQVRSGKYPELASKYLASNVIAHQVISGSSEAVQRSPDNYQAHVEEFLRDFGCFDLFIEELLVQGEKVYVRWRQEGHHIGCIMGYPPTGEPLITVASAVYRVANGKIVEYWIQQENQGLKEQLDYFAKKAN